MILAKVQGYMQRAEELKALITAPSASSTAPSASGKDDLFVPRQTRPVDLIVWRYPPPPPLE